MAEYVCVSGTAGSREEADELARMLVDRRLAACVQVGPVHSTYRWQGKVEQADEYAFRAKAPAALAGKTVAAIKEAHSYEVPEIIVTPIVGGDAAYLAWIWEECRRGREEKVSR